MCTTLRFNIVTNFILIILLVTTLLLGLQYYSSNQIAQKAIDQTFKQVTNNTTMFITRTEAFLQKSLSILSLNNDISDSLDTNKTHPMLDDLAEALKNHKSAKGIYIGYENGDFYEVLKLKKHPNIINLHNPPKSSQWAILSIKRSRKDNKTTLEFLNSKLQTVLSKTVGSYLNPSERPWYKKAMNTTDVVRTDIYEFKSTKTNGITFAKQVPNKKAVIAIDFTLSDLDDFIKKQSFDKESHIILYSDAGELIATSNKEKLYNWDKLFEFFKSNKNGITHTHTHGDVEYFIYHTLTKVKTGKLNIGIIMPKKKLMQPYIKSIENSLYVAVALILLSIPLALCSSSMIVKPIRSLMLENEKIKNREFSEIKNIKTSILELHELSNSLVSMSISIQEYQKSQEELLDSIIKVLADAIDAKSAYTGGHCRRVPEIAQMLTKAAHNKNEGPFKAFSFLSEDEWREFHIGAWLHDCGKVTTPEYVVDKSTKLETIYNRIHEIRTRFEVLYRDAQILYLEEQLNNQNRDESLKKLHITQTKLIKEFEFLAKSNMGGEYMSDDKQELIKSIAKREWIRNFDDRLGLSDVELLRYEGIEASSLPVKEKLLSDKQEHLIKRENFDYEKYKADGFKEEVPEYLYNYGEIYNLCVDKGTLTNEERFKINEHVIMTIKMLEQIPFPAHLMKIPEYAGTHHETLIGTGYPRKLFKKDLSIPARIMVLADIFEALTASDRPYKKAKTLSESLKIMSFMVKEQHIDRNIFELFLDSGIYLEYAETHLKPEQIDEVNIKTLI
ncbi:MAG: HD domain-containing phosphohydrolase [Campylobacterota bacterium]